MTKLETCPWCGSPGKLTTVRRENYGYWPEAIGVKCTGCGALAPNACFDVTEWRQGEGHVDVRAQAKEKAVAAWQQRAKR